MRAISRVALTSCAAFLLVMSAATAHADSEADKGQARALGNQAYVAANSGDWAKAETLFLQAEELYHAPSLLLGLARARAHLGKYIEAWEDYHRILVETLPPNASPALREAVDEARKEISTVEGQRSRVTINVAGAEHPTVTLDGVAINAAALGAERPVNPGSHALHVEATGFLPSDTTFTVAAGGATTASVVLKPAPVAVGPASPAPAQGSTSSGDAATGGTRSSTLRTVGIVGMGVGGVSIVVGAITGGLAMGKHSNLTSNSCVTVGCSAADLATYKSSVSSYNGLGAVSTATFIAGGVLAAAGAVLFLTAPKKEHVATGTWVTPYVGLGNAGAVGTF